MSNRNLRSFEDQAQNVTDAYQHTQRQYDDSPSIFEAVPIADAINNWAVICGCYMGIEQTMKLLIQMRIDTLEPESAERHDKDLAGSHDLGELYAEVHCLDREVVEEYYRVYRSLHEIDSGDRAPETAKEFIEQIGKGYVAWRYILRERQAIPKIHVGAMLEIWCALTEVVKHRAMGDDYPYRNVASQLAQYIDQVFRDAAEYQEWQDQPFDFAEIRNWVNHKGGPLEAGIDLLHHLHHHEAGTENFIKDSPLMSRVLLRAAAEATKKIQKENRALRNRLPTHRHRRKDIEMFHYRIEQGDLSWNANAREFESRAPA